MNFRYLLVFMFILGISEIHSQRVHLIPCPKELKPGQGYFVITPEIQIISSPESNESALFLQNCLKKMMGAKIGLAVPGVTEKGNIRFMLDGSFAKEQYSLDVSEGGIQITASNNTGWFYGVQSLLQLSSSLPGTQNSSSVIKIPEVLINDSPRFPWREFMLDEARFFRGKEQIKMLLDEMAFLKMNVFHWHLVDDQGWRIEIKKYPLLTEVGSKRASSRVDCERCGQTGEPHGGIQSMEPHAGFYTQEEVKEIVRYAEERHITIVPEIEMPGHSSAAIASYPWLGTTGEKIQVPVKFGILDYVYDISNPKVYEFLTDVLDEVMELFPSEVIHIGGDEVRYGQWQKSESISSYMKENNLSSYAGLQVFFTNRISHYLESKGRRMMGWNEILGQNIHKYQSEKESNPGRQLAKGTIVHFWTGNLDFAIEAAGNGYAIVNSLMNDTYISLDYKKLPLSKAYTFEPIPEGLAPAFHDKILGVGCELWGEHLSTTGHMQWMTFPRIAAYAEVGWSEKENKNYERFLQALTKFRKHWEQAGIYYAGDQVVDGN
jgi:hexosaminidase